MIVREGTLNLTDLWQRITGQYEQSEAPSEPIDFTPRLNEIQDEFAVGQEELRELAIRRRAVAMGLGREIG